MKLETIKNKLGFLSKTPFHPQWLITKYSDESYTSIASELQFNVLDIGCGHKIIKKYIKKNVYYCGLDYYQTARNWYGSFPDIYASAESLPIKDKSFSNVLMLDVLEHLPYPELCIKEVSRILKPGGKLILQVPFIYPLHDQPLDFQRWTEFGFLKLFEKTDLVIVANNTVGKPLETAGLIFNIALCKTLLNALNNKRLIAALLLFVPFIVPVVNVTFFLISYLSPDDKFMPISYRITAIKKNGNDV